MSERRRWVVCLGAAVLLGGILGRALDALAPAPEPDPWCVHLAAVRSDPESAASRGPRAASELEDAWEQAGCKEGQ